MQDLLTILQKRSLFMFNIGDLPANCVLIATAVLFYEPHHHDVKTLSVLHATGEKNPSVANGFRPKYPAT